MDAHEAVSAYANSKFDNAPPLKIVHLLYEGAIRFLRQAQEMDPAADPAAFTVRLNKADAVVSELRLSLEPEQSPELCDHLNGLYEFVQDQIRESILEGSSETLPGAISVLEKLLEGWRGIGMTAAPDAGLPRR